MHRLWSMRTPSKQDQMEVSLYRTITASLTNNPRLCRTYESLSACVCLYVIYSYQSSGFSSIVTFNHQARQYYFDASIYMDRESLVAGMKGEVHPFCAWKSLAFTHNKILIRSCLYLNDLRVPLSTLSSASLKVLALDMNSVESILFNGDVTLQDTKYDARAGKSFASNRVSPSREFVQPVFVPNMTRMISVILEAKIKGVRPVWCVIWMMACAKFLSSHNQGLP